jgi:hypothetical protein
MAEEARRIPPVEAAVGATRCAAARRGRVRVAKARQASTRPRQQCRLLRNATAADAAFEALAEALAAGYERGTCFAGGDAPESSHRAAPGSRSSSVAAFERHAKQVMELLTAEVEAAYSAADAADEHVRKRQAPPDAGSLDAVGTAPLGAGAAGAAVGGATGCVAGATVAMHLNLVNAR